MTSPLDRFLATLQARARAATPGPWRGDRVDGTVKYDLLGASGNPVVHGDNGNEPNGPYGIMTSEDERYLAALDPDTVLALVECVEAGAPLLGELSIPTFERVVGDIRRALARLQSLAEERGGK